MNIYLVTKNEGKVKAANSVFIPVNVELEPVEKDYPEIQADTSLEIARHTALEAAKELNAPAIREDHSLFIHALGIPGPYTAYIERKITAERLLELLSHYSDRTGHFEVATVYAEPSGETFEYTFEVPMTFGTESKGENPRGWNGLIRLGDETRAITEYPEEERLQIWNQGYQKVAEHLKSKSTL
jgi:XTP/dITP diphosphohydrolase